MLTRRTFWIGRPEAPQQLSRETTFALTFPGDDDAQQRVGRLHSSVEVLIVVDGEKVSVDVGVSQQHVHTRNVMDGLEEAVELLEAAWAVLLQSEATVFCLKLKHRQRILLDLFISAHPDEVVR